MKPPALKWGTLLQGVPRTRPNSDLAGNVVAIDQSLDDLAGLISAAHNEVVHWQAALARATQGHEEAVSHLRAAQARMVERCKTLGLRAEIVEHSEE